MSEIDIEDLKLYAKVMGPDDNFEVNHDNRRKFALELLRRLPVLEENEIEGGVILQKRLVGLLQDREDQGSQDNNHLLNLLRGLLTGLLTDDTHGPSDYIDKENGEVIVRHRKDLVL